MTTDYVEKIVDKVITIRTDDETRKHEMMVEILRLATAASGSGYSGGEIKDLMNNVFQIINERVGPYDNQEDSD